MITDSVIHLPGICKTFTNPTCFVFISSCFGDWGGSEELWAATAKYLKQQGHKVHVFKTNVAKNHSRIIELQSAGIEVVDLLRRPSFLWSCSNKIIEHHSRWVNRINRFLPQRWKIQFKHYFEILLIQNLKQLQPSLVVISQGDNYDGLHFASICRQLNLPYVIVSHKAHEHIWPVDEIRSYMKETFQHAKRCFFVSRHNLRLTEAQMGQQLIDAEVVRNPHLAQISSPLPWAKPENDCFKLACVARLYILDKGQDILLKVLAQKKWQSRNLHVAFFGHGAHQEALIDFAKMLGVENVSFPGFVDDIVNVWRDFHALILPSRAEGLPLSLVEAMMCGRPGIVTDIGGMPEVVEDNITGFIAQGVCFHALDEALERAWQSRYEWEQMGLQAAKSIRLLVPPDPASVFAQKLLELSAISATELQMTDLVKDRW
jgi:glycosyltransferase involved in cell wall biosynthesis